MIKNKINKGTLYSRIQGAFKSKGEYILFIDSDDLILKEGLYKSYNYIKTNNISMIQFNSVFQINNSLCLNMRNNRYNIMIKQPILSYIFYYNETTKNADELNSALWDKLITRKIAIKSCNFVGKDYYTEIIKKENDVILLFSIFQMADSYKYFNEIGYYYVFTNKDSITNSWKFQKIESSILHGAFVNIRFIYEKSRDKHIGKSIAIFKLQQAFRRYYKCFSKSPKEYSFVNNTLKLLYHLIFLY